MKNTKSPILAMPFFNSRLEINISGFLSDLKVKWGMNIHSIEGDWEALSLNVNGEMILIGHVDSSFPENELKSILDYNNNRIYLPSNVNNTTGHYIFSLIPESPSSLLNKYLLFTKVLNSFLANSNAMGVYYGSGNLIFSTNYYLNVSNELEYEIPIELWIYFGFNRENNRIIHFTKGLKNFDKLEMELDISFMELDEGYNLLYSIVKYVVSNNIVLTHDAVLNLENDKYKVLIFHDTIKIVRDER